MFIGLTDRDSGVPITVNTAHMAVIRPAKNNGTGTDIRMAFDVSAGVHVTESYKYVMEQVNQHLQEKQ